MSTKHINYINRDFESIRQDLIDYSKENYPQLSTNFGNDSSLGSWLVDLMSDCMDSLNYHIDRVYQNTQLNSTTSKSALLNLARSNGLKIPGPKAGMCEVKFSCILPSGYKSGDTGVIDTSKPNWNAAPIIKRNAIVSAGNIDYTTTEDVNFGEQFNYNGFSNRSYVPRRNNNGSITGYTVSKTAIVSAGSTRVYKKILSVNDIEPFMEIMLPDANVMNIEGIIFKESSDINVSPELSEYYIDDEEFKYKNSPITTYKFFEVDSFTDQWRFGSEMTYKDKKRILNSSNTEVYEDYTETSGNSVKTTRIYKGVWQPIRQKFITEYTDNGYMKIIFGGGVDYNQFNGDASPYAQYRLSRIMNNDMLGVLPKAGWTMFVLYKIGGGVEANVSVGAINSIKTMQNEFPNSGYDSAINSSLKSSIINSINVTNISNAVAGKDAPSTNEIKYFIKYNASAQDRCVSVKDYQIKLMQMPPKYGAPFRSAVMEENNKIVISLLGLNSSGKLDKALPSLLASNIVEYLSYYKTITDYVEVKSGKIYNIGFHVDVFIDKTYNSPDVVANVIAKIKDYMSVSNHDMGEDILIGDLEREINNVDGVLGIIKLKAYKINGSSAGYSDDICPLPSITEDSDGLTINGATVETIDLDATDLVLLGDYGCMYEINNATDISVSIKLK